MKLVILPNHEYYSDLTVDADYFAVRLPSQLGDKKIAPEKVVVFDGFIDRETGEKYNHRAIEEALTHIKENQTLTEYKGVSLLDTNVREIWAKAFSQVSREALCFHGCVKRLKPTTVLVEESDPWLGLFSEIAAQLNLNIETARSFGKKDAVISSLLREEYPSPANIDLHRPIRFGLKTRAICAATNFLASIIRLVRGQKPFVMISFFKPLRLMREALLNNKKYYALLLEADRGEGANGAKIFLAGDCSDRNRVVEQILAEYLNALENKKWQVEGLDVTKTLSELLAKYAAASFQQIAGQVDAFDKLFKKNKIKGYLGYCDTPWQHRTIIRLCQKYKIPNAILINGFLNSSFYHEGKTADLTMVYGEHQKDKYLAERKDKTRVIGTPLYDAACEKRKYANPGYPPRKILVGAYDFSPGDINCEYGCSEKFLAEVIEALRETEKTQKINLSITLKLHPGESRSFYEWFLKKKGYREIVIINSGDMQEIISRHDLLVIGHSVAVFEAGLMGIPVLFYNSSRQVMFEPFTGDFSALPSANNRAQLVEVLKKIFTDRRYADSFTDIKTLEPFTGAVDGRSRQNILKVVNEFVERGK